MRVRRNGDCEVCESDWMFVSMWPCDEVAGSSCDSWLSCDKHSSEFGRNQVLKTHVWFLKNKTNISNFPFHLNENVLHSNGFS